ncbi:helix-turn-helix domain-containing protein [Saccharopolyspora sp. 5N102]|uniref:helix-turn-helix domain-containing protein n=1 Tax=Saccharopolyspora sp. 5N102 TaxID=3375155 RepID=UPI0037A0B35F
MAYVQGPEDLRTLLRYADRSDGGRLLLRWLAENVGGWAVLLDPVGAPSEAYPETPNDLLDEAADTIASVVARRYRSAGVDTEMCSVRALAVDAERLGPVLVVANRTPLPGAANAVIADVARLLRLRWRADEADRRRAAVEQAEALNREVILHLLMVGQLDGARRASGALRHELPDMLRVYVFECAGIDRREVARNCLHVSGGQAWIVLCPVYDDHLIVLAPAEPAEDLQTLDEALRELAGERVRIGGGDVVPLRDTSTGYQQASHALAAARNRPSGFARFSPRMELDALLGIEGRAWARAVLAPLLDFTPERPQDPDGDELLSTLQSWLTFYGRSARQLKIHRNTVAARLRRIERTLDGDLAKLETQAVLHLALRLLDHSRIPSRHHDIRDLDALLDGSPVRQWAQQLLSPLLEAESGLLMGTLRSWLRNNAKLEDTADELGFSVVGVRKRLVRIENLLDRSLLNGPSARYDLYLAVRVLWRTAG